MTAVELDPVFVKALKFLHSKAKDSGAQLKALLDDAIAQRKGLKVPSHIVDVGKSSPARSKSDDDSKKKDAEKRPADKGSKDNSEPDVKKPKLESQKSRSKDERDAREKEKEKERAKREKEKREKEEYDAQKLKEKAEKERKEKELASSKAEAETSLVISDEEEPTSKMDAGDFALEMGIACVVCRQFDVSSGNQLVECQECHSLYHQECHKPPVTEEDVSDPRFVWYCSRCTRSLKKMMTQKAVKPKPAAPPTIAGKESSTSSNKSTKTTDTSSKSVSQAFRRIDPKNIVPSADTTNLSSTASKPMVGLAGLAANLHKPKGESKSGGASRKGEQKGEGVKSSSKLEIKPNSGNKSDSSSKPNNSSGNKSDSSSKPSSSGNKSDSSSKPSSSGNKSDSSSKPSSSSGNKSDSSSKPSSSSGNKSDSSSKPSSSSGNKSDSSSKSNSGNNKLDSSSKSSSSGNKSDSSAKSSSSGNKSDSLPKSSSGGSNKSDASSKPSNGGNKLDTSSKSSLSSTKYEERSLDIWELASKDEKEKEKKLDSGYKSIGKVDDKKTNDMPVKPTSLSSSSSSSSGKDEKKSEKKQESGKSKINSEISKLEISSPKSSPQVITPTTPTTPDSPSPSKVNSSTSNKQAVANLSLVTANKRIQMMKKKAQTKPGLDKKLHIK